jgi:hypothetical protein
MHDEGMRSASTLKAQVKNGRTVHLELSAQISSQPHFPTMSNAAHAFHGIRPYLGRANDMPRRPHDVQQPKPVKPPKPSRAPRQPWSKLKRLVQETTGVPSHTSETASEDGHLVRQNSRRPVNIISNRETASETHSSLADAEESDVGHDDPTISHAPSWPIHEGATWPGATSSVVVVASTKSGRLEGRRPATELEWNEARVDDILPLLRELRPAPVDESAVPASSEKK